MNSSNNPVMDLRPLSLADILDYTVEILWKRFWLYFGISVTIQCPAFFIIDLGFKCIGAYLGSKGTAYSDLAGILSLLPLFYLLALFYFLTKGALTVIGSSMILGSPAGYFGALETTLKRLLSISGIALMTMILSSLLLMVPAVVLITTYLEGKQLFQTLLLLVATLLIASIVWMWLMVKFSLAIPASVIEGKAAFAAILRSWEMTGSYWWKTWSGWALVNVVIFIAGSLLIAYNGLSGILFYLVIFPFSAVTETLAFYDLKIRREAFDLEWWAIGREKAFRQEEGDGAGIDK